MYSLNYNYTNIIDNILVFRIICI